MGVGRGQHVQRPGADHVGHRELVYLEQVGREGQEGLAGRLCRLMGWGDMGFYPRSWSPGGCGQRRAGLTWLLTD